MPSITLGAAIAITAVTLIDGSGAPPRPHVTVVIDHGVITAVGETVRPPKGATTIDGSNRFLIPGLFDAHVHLTKCGESSLKLFIANGVTSVRDMGSDIDEVNRWRAEINAGRRIGPRIKTSGPILESPAKVQELIDEHAVEPVAKLRRPVGTPQDADAAVAMLKTKGADFVKIRTFASKETYFAIGDAARRAGLKLVGHASQLSPADLLRSGQLSIEHRSPTLISKDEAERRRDYQALARAGVVVVPTLVTGSGSFFVPLWRADAILKDPSGAIDSRRRYVPRNLLSDWSEQLDERRSDSTDWRALARSIYSLDEEMHAAGMRFLAGTDAAVLLIYPGFSLHDELERMVEVLGFTPMEVLLSATRYPAELLGMQDEVGTIAVGNGADLVLLDDNPLQSISNTRRIAAVIARGIYYDRKALDRLLADAEREAKR